MLCGEANLPAGWVCSYVSVLSPGWGDGGGAGRSVCAGERCLQAERAAHPLCAGRHHRLPAGILPAHQAALGAG